MYHSAAAHWVQAILIEAVTHQDYRQFIRDNVTKPLGLQGLWVGVPDALQAHTVGAYERPQVASMCPWQTAIRRPSGGLAYPVAVAMPRLLT